MPSKKKELKEAALKIDLCEFSKAANDNQPNYPDLDSQTLPDYYGHRNRLKEIFKSSKLGALQDFMILELLLFLVIPRRDVRKLSRELIKHFGSLTKVLYADDASLLSFSGIGDSALHCFKLVREIAFNISRKEVSNKPLISNKEELLKYLRTSIGNSPTEKVHILYLNSKNMLLFDEIHDHGTVDRIGIYPREVVKKALRYNASAVIISHNHPSGFTSPSKDDIRQTEQLKAALEPIEVMLHDHVIISKSCYFSFRLNGLL